MTSPSADGPHFCDTLIVGAGPAGASCALWLKRLGLRPLLVDAEEAVGGLLRATPYENAWIATSPGATGPELAAGVEESLRLAEVERLADTRIIDATRNELGFIAHAVGAHGRTLRIETSTLVLATGVQAEDGGLPATPHILIGPGAHIEAHDFTGLSVAILGGGDNGFENFDIIRRSGARHVALFARTVRARPALVAQVPPDSVSRGPYQVDAQAMSVNGQVFDRILVMYGWRPQSRLGAALGAAVDERGYLRTAADCETTVSGLYAVGEVTRRGHPCVVTAMADGIDAAKAIEARLG